MEIKIKTEEMQKRKLFIATPMYGGQCCGCYTAATTRLASLLTAYGIQFGFAYLFNESLITRARNILVDQFLESDCTHMMFIDSDIGFQEKDVLALLAIAEPESDKKIVAAPYPKKSIEWGKIKTAVEQGFGGDNGEDLAKYGGSYPFASKEGTFKISEPMEVTEAGTGFMIIQREVFEKFREAYPDFYYFPDSNEPTFEEGKEVFMYFQALIDPEHKRYLSEDYMFCKWASKIGISTWLCPWIELDHMGSYLFKGSLDSIASIGANPS